MASRAIRSTLHEVDRMAAYCEDDAARLRAFTIDVGGADACPDPNGKRALRQFFTATGRTQKPGLSRTASGRQCQPCR